MVFERLLKMSQCELERAGGGDLRRLTQGTQLGPYGSLSVGESSPDVVGGRKTQFAVELTKGVEFIAVASSVIEELPQLFAGEEELFDFVSHPDAESATTA